MKEINGNLWNHWIKPDTAIVITTNGTVKNNGECVMGRGCALEAKNRFPQLQHILGSLIQKHGNHVFDLGNCIVSFPVKHNWWEQADATLIERSAKELVKLANEQGWHSIVIPRPGCGNGRLLWSSVKPVLEVHFDDRFSVITF